MNFTTLTLKKGKEASIQRRHHWIFSGALAQIPDTLNPGDWVTIQSAQKQILGHGFFNGGSIAVKILSHSKNIPGREWLRERISAALLTRKEAGLLPSGHTNCFRLLNAEGDGFPGLIADVYGDTLILQLHHTGIIPFLDMLAEELPTLLPFPVHHILVQYPAAKNETVQREFILGNAEEGTVKENGHLFHVNWMEGQKTGFFLDQRDNRQLLKNYSAGKKVLNTFSYTGGFSVYALAGGATQVTSVDVSKWAIAQCGQNIALNGSPAEIHHGIAVDAISYLQQEQETFDTIILDPPAFAKSLSARHNALMAYKRINLLAMKKLPPGGVLFTFSCSQVVDKFMFRSVILAAAIEAGREVKILHQLSQPADHPINIFHPESEYLKGLVVCVI